MAGEMWYYIIVANSNSCTLGEDITITFLYDDSGDGGSIFSSDPLYCYEDNVLVETYDPADEYLEWIYIDNKWTLGTYTYTPSTLGEHTIYFTDGYNPSNALTITVTDNPTGSWSIGNKEVASLTINNKEIQSIVRISDNTILYEKPEEPALIITLNGTSFTPYDSSYNKGLTGSNMVIDWGDGTSEPITSGVKLPSHTYSSSGEYNIKITGEITSIGEHCFRSCSKLTSVNIPDSVTSIGTNCFQGCLGLTSINIPNSVTSIGDSCFRYCSGLTSVNIPNSVTSIGTNCFENCSGLTSINIPNSVTSIGTSCFIECLSLTSVNIPDSVTSIGNYCFQNCSNLTSVNIPDSVTSIGSGCFQNCSNLTSINIPNSVTIIGSSCFRNCSNLTSINIPNNVTYINMYCFYGCSSLTSVNIPNGVTSIGQKCFYNCKKLNDYQLYWTTPPMTYDSSQMPNNTNTYFTIPYGTTANYVAKSFPSNKLIERSG